MIPIRDNQPAKNFALGTCLLIGTNLFVFILQWRLNIDEEVIFYLFGLVPGKYTIPDVSQYFTFLNQVISLFSYMFFHAGFWHFMGNMWFLYVFGDKVEFHFGTLRFLIFYLLSGVASGILHFLLNPFSTVPTVGASGAVAGVMGAYYLLFPRSKILTLIPIIIFPWFIEIPAFIFLGVWFLLQFINAAGAGEASGVAWWAHVGGFIAGILLVHLNKRLPNTGARQRLDRFTQKRHTPKLQVVTPRMETGSLDLFGDIVISSLEALTGAKKRITIPMGLYRPLYRVVIPPGVRQGSQLRLSGLGRSVPNGAKGDLFLRVVIKNVI